MPTKTVFGTTPTRRRIRATMSSADAVARIKDVIGALMPQGDVVISEQVNKTWEYLASEEPELLARYLNILGRSSMANVVRKLQKSQQVQPLAQAIFEPSTPSVFQRLVSTKGSLVPVGELTKTDHVFLSAGYKKTANRNKNLSKFHETIAGNLGSLTTAEVFSEESYTRLYKSIVGEEF